MTAGDCFNEHAAASGLMALPPSQRPSILRAIADPTQRREVPYAANPISAAVPLNSTQRAALDGLRYEVEGLQVRCL